MSTVLRAFSTGAFPDVAFAGDTVYLARREGDPAAAGRLVVTIWALPDGEPIRYWEELLPAGSPAFPVLLWLEGRMWLAYHDGSEVQQGDKGLHLLILGGTPDEHWHFPAYGNSPCVFGGHWFAWQATPATDPNPYAIIRMDLLTGEQRSMGLGHPTGLARITEAGMVFTVDEDRNKLAGAVNPDFAEDLAVGEDVDDSKLGAVWQLGTSPSEVRGLLWPGLTCKTPKCAVTDRYTAVATWGPDVRTFTGTREQLKTFVMPPQPQPQPEPKPLNVPVVTVNNWTLSELLDGREFSFQDSANPDLKLSVRVWVEGGSMFARISNAAGMAQTGARRPVKPCPDPKPPDPQPTPSHVSITFGPNGGSVDFQNLFTSLDQWEFDRARIGTLRFWGGNILPLNDIPRPNFYEQFVAVDAFRKLLQWQIKTEIGVDFDSATVIQAINRVRTAGGEVHTLCYDHAFASDSSSISPEKLAEYYHDLKQFNPALSIGVYAPFPLVSTTAIRGRLEQLIALGMRPQFCRFDVDPTPNQRAQFTQTVFDFFKKMSTDLIIPLQIVINAQDASTDAAYVAAARTWHSKVKTFGQWNGLMVESWAGPAQGPRQQPHNLPESDSTSHCSLVRTVLEAWTEPAPMPQPPDPKPEPEPPSPDRYALQTLWNTYLGLNDDRTVVQIAEPTCEAEIVTLDASSSGLKLDGKFTATEDSKVLLANRDTAGEWEKYRVKRDGDIYRLQARNSFWVSAHEDVKTVMADGPGPSTWEGLKKVPLKKAISPRLVRSGKFFALDGGASWTAIESSEFSLFKRYLEGENIRSVCSERMALGINMLRVWLLNSSVVSLRDSLDGKTNVKDGIHPNQYPDFYQKLTTFVQMLGSDYGFAVEVTAFTSTVTNSSGTGLMPNDSDQLRHWESIIAALRPCENALLEAYNEGDQYNNKPSATLRRPDGVLASSGSNGADSEPPQPIWDYVLYHTNGLPEFQRKVGHNAMEWADKYSVPAMSNENTRYTDQDNNPNHAYDAAMGGALLCAGSCYHSTGGKYSRPFTSEEKARAAEWVAGAKSVPLEYQVGAYVHHQELEGPDCIRAYGRRLGDGREYIIKIRP